VAKAQFQRYQKVWVEAVGAWATVDRVIPVWARDFDEPVKITYDVGLGREFRGDELKAEEATGASAPEAGGEWRILRARNKWQQPEDCGHHPFPGTFPVVVTDPQDWGGWRTPGAEYDRAPERIEFQARLIAHAPKLMAVAQALRDFVAEAPDDAPAELHALATTAAAILHAVGSVKG
jgi:hypothetical protein